jgi:ABC-type polysaccharide/polyol phosphate export permease
LLFSGRQGLRVETDIIQAGDAMSDAPPWLARARAGMNDLREGLRRWQLWGAMGWYDVRQHYRRSMLGPFWLTLSMAIMLCALGFLYGTLFGQPLEIYLPYLALGLIFWSFIASFMIEGGSVFASAAPYIHQVPAPLSLYVFRLMWRNLIILAHNSIVYVAVAAIFGIWPGFAGLLVIPGLAIVCLFGVAMSFLLGVLAARFRDIPPIVASLVQIFFFVTPILWRPEQVPARAFVTGINPFFHLLTIVRQPLLGEVPPWTSWAVALGITLMALVLASVLIGRFRSRIPYWV